MPTSSTPSRSSGDTGDDADRRIANGPTSNDERISFPDPSFDLSKELVSSQPHTRLDDDGLEVTMEEVEAMFAVEEASSRADITSTANFGVSEPKGKAESVEPPPSLSQAQPDMVRKISPSNSRKNLLDDSASSKRAPATKPKRRTLAFLSARDRPLAVRPAPRPQAMWVNVHPPQSAPGMHVWGTPIPQSPGAAASPVGPHMGTPFNTTGVPHGGLPAPGKQAIAPMTGSPSTAGQVPGHPLMADALRQAQQPGAMTQPVMSHPMQVPALGQPINQPMVGHQPLPAQHLATSQPMQTSMPVHMQPNHPTHQAMQGQQIHSGSQPHTHHMASHPMSPHSMQNMQQDMPTLHHGASSPALSSMADVPSPHRPHRYSMPASSFIPGQDGPHHLLQHQHGRHSLQTAYSSPQLNVSCLFQDQQQSFSSDGPIGLSLRKSTSLADLLNAASS